MGVRIPRITLNANYEAQSAFGDLGLLSIGYGLHQAWIYSTMFATPTTYNTAVFITGFYGVSVSLTFVVSIFVYALCLIFASIMHQRLLRLYVSKPLLIVAALLMSGGTALLLISLPPESEAMFAVEMISGVLTGIGSSTLLLAWGVAYARCDTSSIALNGTIAIVVGFTVYAFAIRHTAPPINGIVPAIIPLIELGMLWVITPEPFYRRGCEPIFKPLAVNKRQFVLKFGIPVFAFGFTLGLLRQSSVQLILPAATTLNQILVVAGALCAAALILITVLALGKAKRWDRLFRPIIPFAAIALVFVPFALMDDFAILGFMLLVGYMCFEALMWIFFGEVSQSFKVSPLFIFGLGRGLLAIALLIGSFLPSLSSLEALTHLPFGDDTAALGLLLVMVIAYTMLPNEREILDVVAPCPVIKSALEADEAPTMRVRDIITVTGTDAAGESAEAAGEALEAAKTPAKAPAQQASLGAALAERAHNVPVSTSDSALDAAPSEQPESAAGRNEPPASPLAQNLDEALRARCDAIAQRYLLSPREIDVLACLARGLNSASIQDKLFISEGTAKTHIRRIYRKCDVHTQQELIRMVETVIENE